MGVSLETWRAKIGSFAQPSAKSRFRPPQITLTYTLYRTLAWIILASAVCVKCDQPVAFVEPGEHNHAEKLTGLACKDWGAGACLSTVVMSHSMDYRQITSPAYAMTTLMADYTSITQQHAGQLAKIMLQAGDVESNPGPVDREKTAGSSRTTRQTTLLNSGGLSREPTLSDIMKEIRDSRAELNTRFDELVKENKTLRCDLDAVQLKLVELEDRSRRNNLIISGIAESRTETWEETENKLTTTLSEDLSITKMKTLKGHIDLERRPRGQIDQSL